MTVTSGALGSTKILNRTSCADTALPKASLARIRIGATAPPRTAPFRPSPLTTTRDGSTLPGAIVAMNGARLGTPTPFIINSPKTFPASVVK